MKKEATVLEVRKDEVILGCDKESCEGCKGSFFCSVKDSSFSAFIDQQIELKKGDKVIVDMPSGRTLKAVFISLGLPMIMFLPGYLLGIKITGSEGYAFLFSMFFVALGFLIGFLYFRKRKKLYTPKVEGRKD